MPKSIVATITMDQKGRLHILPGEENPVHQLHLTEDHIFELVTINNAFYQKQLVEGIKAGLISPNP